MALVRCIECGTKISQYADQCPSCGVPCQPMSDEQYAEQVGQIKAARRHDLKWWCIAIAFFALYLFVFGPSNARRAQEREEAELEAWRQEQEQIEQDQRVLDAWRTFNR